MAHNSQQRLRRIIDDGDLGAIANQIGHRFPPIVEAINKEQKWLH